MAGSNSSHSQRGDHNLNFNASTGGGNMVIGGDVKTGDTNMTGSAEAKGFNLSANLDTSGLKGMFGGEKEAGSGGEAPEAPSAPAGLILLNLINLPEATRGLAGSTTNIDTKLFDVRFDPKKRNGVAIHRETGKRMKIAMDKGATFNGKKYLLLI